MKFEEYKKEVDDMKKRLFLKGERFFYRKNPNKKNEYDTSWQVGIGNKKNKLIDAHIAKIWDEDIAKILVTEINLQWETLINDNQ